MLKKSVPSFQRSLLIYCLFAIFLALGYILGVIQSSGWCSDFYCKHIGSKHQPLVISNLSTSLLIVIFSGPQNSNQRNTIRKTWLLTKGTNEVLHYFVIGTASLDHEGKEDLLEENKQHNDLLLLSAVSDSYSKLSKKLLETLKWVDHHMNFTFLLKVDDDTFVRLDVFCEQMRQKSNNRLYWGFFDGRAQVKTKGKWAEDNWILCDRYLPYAKGGGYVISSDLVRFIAQNADFFTLYKSEDVSLGTWLAPLEINRVHDPNFDTEFQSRGCHNSYVVTHKQTDLMIMAKYQSLKTLGKLCSTEHRSKYSYIYNWKAPPSLCCIRNDSKVP